MSLYNLVHGQNLYADVLLTILGVSRNDVPRYRDCWFDGTHIAVHTRVGGGNRSDYQEGIESMRLINGYERDADDDYDFTYATFYYTPPEKFLAELAKVSPQTESPGERWNSFLEKMKSSPDDPQVRRAVEGMKPTIEAIKGALGDK